MPRLDAAPTKTGRYQLPIRGENSDQPSESLQSLAGPSLGSGQPGIADSAPTVIPLPLLPDTRAAVDNESPPHRLPAPTGLPPGAGEGAAPPLPWSVDEWLRDADADATERATRFARQQAREQALRRGQRELSHAVFEWVLRPAPER